MGNEEIGIRRLEHDDFHGRVRLDVGHQRYQFVNRRADEHVDRRLLKVIVHRPGWMRSVLNCNGSGMPHLLRQLADQFCVQADLGRRKLADRGPRPRKETDLLRTELQGLARRHQVDDLVRDHDGGRVSRNIDVESGMHLLVRVIRRRVAYDGNPVAELSSIANGPFKASMGNQPHHNELLYAVLLELKI